MRVAIPIHSFAPGGVERVALRLAEHWQTTGVDVVVVLGRDRGQCRADAPALDYHTLPEPWRTDGWQSLWMAWSLGRLLLRERVDLVFCPGNTYTNVAVLLRLLLGNRCPPVIVKISNDLVRQDMSAAMQWGYRRWLRMQGRVLDKFIGLAEPMRGQLEQCLAVPPSRVCVIPDPALAERDLARLGALADARRRDDNCTYLSIGRLSAQKNPALLVAAFALAVRPGDRLVIAGDGPERLALARQIAQAGLGGQITLAGHVADVAPLLEAADVLVLSSDYEGVPAVVLEALAAGLPVAATDCCASMRWLLNDGAFGALAPPRDPAALARAMATARAADPPQSAMQAFAAQFTLERSGALYLEEMQRLIREADADANDLSQARNLPGQRAIRGPE